MARSVLLAFPSAPSMFESLSLLLKEEEWSGAKLGLSGTADPGLR